MGGSCPVGCRQWSASFGDCLCNGSDLTGFAFGLASIVCMAVCFLPQVRGTFKPPCRRLRGYHISGTLPCNASNSVAEGCPLQIWRNWRSHSSEGLALGLVCTWQLGDVANIVGELRRPRPGLIFATAHSGQHASLQVYSSARPCPRRRTWPFYTLPSTWH